MPIPIPPIPAKPKPKDPPPPACDDGSCGAAIKNGVDSNGNKLDALQLFLQGLDLALLKVIDNKLGPQLQNGGISSFLVRFQQGFNAFTKWTRLDRILNILIFAATVQNHIMLSNNLAQTLIGALTNVLTLIGLNDSEGNSFSVESIINSSIENFVKSIVGAENYAELSAAWAKANRIYQAATNVLNSFQNIANTILSGMEVMAGNTSKIGNALRKAGEVLETAYGWMNPQPKFNKVTQTLENLNQAGSTIQQVTQVPLDVIQATTDLQSETITRTDAERLALSIKNELATPPFIWEKGHFICTYYDDERGYKMRLQVKSKLEGERVVKKILSIQDHIFNDDKFQFVENSRTFAAIPGTHKVYGRNVKKPRERPIASVKFRYAQLLIWGQQNAVNLVSVAGRLRSVIQRV